MKVVNNISYRKPSVQFWTAEELDVIEATMSGGPGIVVNGADKPRESSVWYTSPYGGAVFVLVDYEGSARVRVYETLDNGTVIRALFDLHCTGGVGCRFIVGYGGRFRVNVSWVVKGYAAPSCNFAHSTDYLSNENGRGALWAPSDWGIRPQKTPICRMKWYISGDYSAYLLKTLQADFYDKCYELLKSGVYGELGDRISAAFGPPMAVAVSIENAFLTILGVCGLIQRAQLIEVVRERQGKSFKIEIYDYGDGGSTVFDARLSVSSWDGKRMYGETGYDGDFTNNSTANVDEKYKDYLL